MKRVRLSKMNFTKSMAAALTLLLACSLLTTTGCEKPPKLISETKPSSSQIEFCRVRLYLNRTTDIEPLGFQHYSEGGDIIWFKFRTKVVSLPTLFDKDKLNGAQVEEISKFKIEYDMPAYTQSEKHKPEWWDVDDFKLVGGRIDTPQTEILSIGVSNSDGRENPGEPAVVFVMLKQL